MPSGPRLALALVAIATGALLPAQALRWNVPEGGALTYRRTTDHAAMAAPQSTRQQEVVVAGAEAGGHEWRYFACPAGKVPAGFETPGFDDSGWALGRGEFGTDVGRNPAQRTHWGAEMLLLRSRIDLRKKPKAVLFRISHDDGVRVYWNGQQLVANDAYGRNRVYVVAGKQLTAMTAGDGGLLAASCQNTGGAQMFDLSMTVMSSLPPGVKSAEDLQQAVDQLRQTADHVQREFLGAFRPPGLLLHGELDAAGQRVAVPPADLREIAFWVACDLERGVTGGSYQQDLVRIFRLGDVQLRGKVSSVDAEGWQTIEATVKNAAPPALRGDSKRYVQMHVEPHVHYGIDGKVVVRRRLELQGDKARVAECECTLQARMLRGKERTEHCADFSLRESYAFAAVRDGQDAEFRIAVSKAIDKGTAFLRKSLENLGGHGLQPDRADGDRSYNSGRLALGLLAMIKGGVKRDDPVLVRALGELRQRKLVDTYSLGNALMVIEAYHRGNHDTADVTQGAIDRQRRRTVPEEDKRLMQKWTDQLLGNLDTRVAKDAVLRFNYVADRRFDNSVNQYGLLGLYSAHLCGIDVPASHWEAAATHLITAQCESNGTLSLDLTDFRTLARGNTDERRTATVLPVRPAGWTYEDPKAQGESQPAWGSMTCAGITGLAISQAALLDLGQKRIKLQNEADAARYAGFGWLAQNLCVRYHPGHMPRQHQWFYYYLYGLERAALLSGIGRIQGRDWYFEGAMVLTGAQQENGSWPGELWSDMEIERTAMAVLFLKRGTTPVLTGQ